MTPQSRMLLVLGVVSVGAVSVLGMLAQRYTAVFERQQARQERLEGTRISASSRERQPRPVAGAAARDDALRAVDAFVRARRTLVPSLADAALDEQALRAARTEALRGAGLTEEEYVRVRAVYRSWRAGGGAVQEPYRTVLEMRRAALEELDLGPAERRDP